MIDVEEIELLAAWEKGRAAGATERSALSLLAAAYPQQPLAALAQLTIGERDALLLELRKRLFGVHLHGISNCAACNQTLTVELNVEDLHMLTGRNPTHPVALTEDGYAFSLRLPDTYDLLAVRGASSLSEGRLFLLQRLLLSATYHGDPVKAEEIPAGILDRIEEALAEADPQTDIQLNLVCEACEHRSVTVFDIASYLWAEVEAWAIRTLREIHELAHAYGWSEAEILRMSPWRRRCYMELLGV